MAHRSSSHTIDPAAATAMLAGPRIAVIGASDRSGNFGATIHRALREHGVEAVAVHPTAPSVDGEPCYASIAEVPGPVDAAIVAVSGPPSVEAVKACEANGVGKVWLFQGIGGRGAASDEAIRAAEDLGLEVIPGACPLMFLEPVGWFHRLHRAARRRNGSVSSAPVAVRGGSGPHEEGAA
jgi:acyl-CoA synthetase (NDP forming)